MSQQGGCLDIGPCGGIEAVMISVNTKYETCVLEEVFDMCVIVSYIVEALVPTKVL